MDMPIDQENKLQAAVAMDDAEKDSFWDCSKTTKSSPDENIEFTPTATSVLSIVDLTNDASNGSETLEFPFFSNQKNLPTERMTLDNLNLAPKTDYFNPQQHHQQLSILSVPRMRNISSCSIISNSSNSSSSDVSCPDSKHCNNYYGSINNRPSRDYSVVQMNANYPNYNNTNLQINHCNDDDDNCIAEDHFTFSCLMNHFVNQQQQHDQVSMDFYNLEPRPIITTSEPCYSVSNY
jgi:hypothetical protein